MLAATRQPPGLCYTGIRTMLANATPGGAYAARGTHCPRHRSFSRDRPGHRAGAGPRRGRRCHQLRRQRGIGHDGRRPDPEDGAEGGARPGRRGRLPGHVPHGSGSAQGVRASRHPHQQCRDQLRQDFREDGPRVVAGRARDQPGRRVQLHQGLHRPDDQAELGTGGQHHVGDRADRQLRSGQLRGLQGRGRRLHQIAREGTGRQEHHRECGGAGFHRNGHDRPAFPRR